MRATLATVAIFAILVLSPPGFPGAPVQDAPDKLDLRFHFQKGQIYRLIPTVEEKNTQVLDGVEQTTTSTATMGQTLEVVSVHDDGSATIKITFGPTALKKAGPQGAFVYDSTNPPKDVPVPAVGLALVVGKSYAATMTPAGEIVKLEGVDALVQAMVEALPNNEELRAAMRDGFVRQFGEDGLRELLANITTLFPDEPVAVGDSWTRQIKPRRGMPRVVKATYTLTGREDGVATVQFKATTGPDPDAEPIKSDGPATMRHTVEGTQTGTFKLDEASGFILEGTITHKLQGDVIVANVPGREGDLVIPTRVEIKVSIEASLSRAER